MPEDSRDKDASAEQDKSGPDYFGYYKQEVAYLLSQTKDCLQYAFQTSDLAAGVLFRDAVGAGISDFRKERLNALLWQSVPLLTQEVVEVCITLSSLAVFHKNKS